MNRSQMMAGIRGSNTKPEMLVRRLLHRQGFRFRLHCKNLPGKPDIILPKYRAVIFVHGCFWHGHDCSLFKWPKTHPEFWRAKIEGNRDRDQKVVANLNTMAWRVAVIWECSLRGKKAAEIESVISLIAQWLKTGNNRIDIKGVG